MKRWTEMEEQQLRKLSKTMTTGELAVFFGRTLSAVHKKSSRLGISLKRPNAWRKNEIEIMRDYENMTISELQERLNRTMSGIYHFASEHGLSRKAWTVKEVRKLHEIAPNTKVRDMADMFQRSTDAIRRKLTKEGLNYLRCAVQRED